MCWKAWLIRGYFLGTDPMKWTEDSIAYAVANTVFPWRRYVVVPNVSWGLLPHEADLVALSSGDWLSEVEIKVTKGDFLADRDKWKHQLAKVNGTPAIISAFYYAMPSSVWEKCKPEDLPHGAGLILVGQRWEGDSEHAKVAQKPTDNPRARKLRPDEREQLMRLGYMRYWSRQNAVERLLFAIHRDAEKIAQDWRNGMCVSASCMSESVHDSKREHSATPSAHPLESAPHVDDWLDERHAVPPSDPGEQFAVEWLEHFRRPAGEKDYKWLAENPLFCTYVDGKRYRCIGCSRLGDVWLTKDFSKVNGYDMRILVSHCTAWSKTP